MNLRIKLSHLAVGVVAGAMLAGGGYALATTQSGVIHACENNRTHALLVKKSCGKGYAALTWNQKGLKGASGVRGATGVSGAPGTAGAAATVSVGNVATGAAGTPASVTNAGTPSNAKLNFVIPQGTAGQNGTDATNTGPTAYGQVWMGSGSAELAPGSGLNVLGVSGGGGGATVRVQNCTAATPTEPIVTVTADDDAADNLPGADDTTSYASAYVTGYGDDNSPGARVVIFSITTFNPILTTNTLVNSDFSFTVNC